MVQVPNVPNMFVAKELPVPGGGRGGVRGQGTGKETERKGTQRRGEGEGEGEVSVPEYRWPALEGRYLWYGSGREIVNAHLDEMGGEAWKGVEAMVERCEKKEKERQEAKEAVGGRLQQRQARAVRRALGMEESEEYVLSGPPSPRHKIAG